MLAMLLDSDDLCTDIHGCRRQLQERVSFKIAPAANCADRVREQIRRAVLQQRRHAPRKLESVRQGKPRQQFI
jgi:hypothetical protein